MHHLRRYTEKGMKISVLNKSFNLGTLTMRFQARRSVSFAAHGGVSLHPDDSDSYRVR